MAHFPLLLIVGPTGIGKTKLSIRIAKEFGAEVVSLDSLQVYKHAKIMTAQATVEEMQGVKHHLIDYLDPAQEPRDFPDQAVQVIHSIHQRRKLAILCGGSTSLTEQVLFHSALKNVSCYTLVLSSSIGRLGSLLDARIDEMVKQGLLQEVQELYRLEKQHHLIQPFSKGIWKAIGYLELRKWCKEQDSEKSSQLVEMGIQTMKINTREYAVKQLLWMHNHLIPLLRHRNIPLSVFRVESASLFPVQVVNPSIQQCREWFCRVSSPTTKDDFHLAPKNQGEMLDATLVPSSL